MRVPTKTIPSALAMALFAFTFLISPSLAAPLPDSSSSLPTPVSEAYIHMAAQQPQSLPLPPPQAQTQLLSAHESPSPSPSPSPPAYARMAPPYNICQLDRPDQATEPICHLSNYHRLGLYSNGSGHGGSTTSMHHPKSVPGTHSHMGVTRRRRRSIMLEKRFVQEQEEQGGLDDMLEYQGLKDFVKQARVHATTEKRKRYIPKSDGIGCIYAKDGAQGR